MKFLKVLGNKIRHALPVVSDFGVDVRRCYGTIVADLTNSFTNFGTAQRAENGGIIVSSSKDIFSGNTTNRSPASTATFGNNGGLSIIITE